MVLADLDDPFQHHFQLTDRLQMQIITEGIVVNPSLNSVSFPSFKSEETLFWSLPEQFLGNKLTSYGGFLSFTQQYTAETDGEPFNDADVQITVWYLQKANQIYTKKNTYIYMIYLISI